LKRRMGFFAIGALRNLPAPGVVSRIFNARRIRESPAGRAEDFFVTPLPAGDRVRHRPWLETPELVTMSDHLELCRHHHPQPEFAENRAMTSYKNLLLVVLALTTLRRGLGENRWMCGPRHWSHMTCPRGRSLTGKPAMFVIY
jgi:hypothetical protein